MKRAAILISTLGLLLFPSSAFAEVHVQVSNSEGSSQVNVSSETSGSSTVCHNGTCTTTGGENTSTVCINGTCTTTNENVDYKSEDGTTKVEVNNFESSVAASPALEAKITTTPEPTVTTSPEVEKKVKEIEAKVQEMDIQVKQRVKDKDGAIAIFIQTELASLHSLISNLFN